MITEHDRARAREKFCRARSSLLIYDPFFGELALNLKIVEDDTCPTSWTDGVHLGYNPEYILSLESNEIRGLVAHEVAHCALGHMWRRGDRDALLWNIACDYAINAYLRTYYVLPKGGLYERDYVGKSAEQIYALLDKKCDRKGLSREQYVDILLRNVGAVGDIRTPKCTREEEEEEIKEKWRHAVQEARRKYPDGGIQGVGECDALTAKTSEPEGTSLETLICELKQKLTRYSKEDYTFAKPNPRYLHTGLYLPSISAPSIGPIIVAVDTSSSITDRILASFIEALQVILDEVKPEYLHVISCDTEIHAECIYTPLERISKDAKDYPGRGGTDFRPVFEKIEKEGLKAECLVYLTDLEGVFPDEPPAIRTYWAVYNRKCGVAPAFGEVVHIEA